MEAQPHDRPQGPDIIAVPTTAGTGAEATSGCGVFDPESGIKLWAGGPNARPSVSLGDPVLSTTMPPRVTADTGFDALSQAIEAIITLRVNPYADALLLMAVETIGRFLPRAFANGQNSGALGDARGGDDGWHGFSVWRTDARAYVRRSAGRPDAHAARAADRG